MRNTVHCKINSMETCLGVRVEPSRIHWAVVEGSRQLPTLLAADDATAPVQWEEAKALSWYRDRVLHIIGQYHPDTVAVRYEEPKARSAGNATKRRARIEGVVLEAADSKALRIMTGALVTISSNLNTKSAKNYLKQEDFRGLDWSKQNDYRREAIMVAVSALER